MIEDTQTIECCLKCKAWMISYSFVGYVETSQLERKSQTPS